MRLHNLKPSISELSYQDALELVRRIRSNREASFSALSRKISSVKSRVKKGRSKKAEGTKLTKEQMEEIIRQLEGTL